MVSQQDEGTKRKDSWWRFAPLALVLCGLVAAYALGWHRYVSLMYLADSQDRLQALVAEHYAKSLAGFGLLYALAVAFSLPAASVLTVFAGFLFGCVVGGSVVAIAATLGATAVFFAARSAFGEVLERKIGGKAARLAQGFEENAFGYLLFLRLAPIFPFFVVNIAAGLFRIPLRTYVIATLIGILPGTFVFAYLGEGIGGVLDIAQQSGAAPSLKLLLTPKIKLGLALLALLALAPVVLRYVRNRRSRLK
ncbi:MAG: TVP38/TMEM64 family protein [Mesorhizobium sp.]